MSLYREFRFFSPALDSEAARLSMVDSRGQEYYAVVAVEEGKSWRERRDGVLTAIDDAIRAGAPPGEVRCPGTPTIHPTR